MILLPISIQNLRRKWLSIWSNLQHFVRSKLTGFSSRYIYRKNCNLSVKYVHKILQRSVILTVCLDKTCNLVSELWNSFIFKVSVHPNTFHNYVIQLFVYILFGHFCVLISVLNFFICNGKTSTIYVSTMYYSLKLNEYFQKYLNLITEAKISYYSWKWLK